MSYTAFDPANGVLTPAMRDLLQALADGETVRAHARRMKKSDQTVKNALRLIRQTLGADTTVQAACMGIRRGIID